jgi:hypothetical protein
VPPQASARDAVPVEPRIEPGDQEAFDRAAAPLVARVVRLAPGRAPLGVDAVRLGDLARTALEWKWQHGGALATWSGDEIGDFLLGWCPAQLVGRSGDWAGMPEAVELLADRGDEGSAIDLAAAERLAQATRQFDAAMDDPANWGPGKTMFANVRAVDRGEMAELMEAFSALPLDVQEQLADHADGTRSRWNDLDDYLDAGLASLLLPLHLVGSVELAMIADGAADAAFEELGFVAADEPLVRDRTSRKVAEMFRRLETAEVLTWSEGSSGTVVTLTESGRSVVRTLLLAEGLEP